ncbi:NAD(P)H-dependent 6'-deoxychalcone synthase-like [Neltuma alba]|uniref:NAD(P)H-dependent 6'-deoxychalcone synthase-like n=1 Tax=Neltuma alba TaxID=207710 RepID=UPI0010A34063|nr:NAD(P)H-dependent 6'-deoxychalcone synthase-like [Prosopis alba]
MAVSEIPCVVLGSSSSGEVRMPVIGMGCAPELTGKVADTKEALVEAIRQCYRHFDTASVYGSEAALGEAIKEALKLGLVPSRQHLFVTSKLWCNQNHPHLVLPALQNSLRNLQLEYLDLYLVHFPISAKPGKLAFPIEAADVVHFDLKGVWAAMEDCQRLGLTRAIGVSNFSIKKLDELLSFATIPPAVNQVEMNLAWQQKKLVDYCKSKGIVITAFSPLRQGVGRGSNEAMESDVVKEIAEARGKSSAQVCLRWLYEQGVTFVPKSYNKERMKQNLQIFDWSLTEDDHKKISEIKQQRLIDGPTKPPLPDLYDDEI